MKNPEIQREIVFARQDIKDAERLLGGLERADYVENPEAYLLNVEAYLRNAAGYISKARELNDGRRRG